jgi:hypothetical protein
VDQDGAGNGARGNDERIQGVTAEEETAFREIARYEHKGGNARKEAQVIFSRTLPAAYVPIAKGLEQGEQQWYSALALETDRW